MRYDFVVHTASRKCEPIPTTLKPAERVLCGLREYLSFAKKNFIKVFRGIAELYGIYCLLSWIASLL